MRFLAATAAFLCLASFVHAQNSNTPEPHMRLGLLLQSSAQSNHDECDLLVVNNGKLQSHQPLGMVGEWGTSDDWFITGTAAGKIAVYALPDFVLKKNVNVDNVLIMAHMDGPANDVAIDQSIAYLTTVTLRGGPNILVRVDAATGEVRKIALPGRSIGGSTAKLVDHLILLPNSEGMAAYSIPDDKVAWTAKSSVAGCLYLKNAGIFNSSKTLVITQVTDSKLALLQNAQPWITGLEPMPWSAVGMSFNRGRTVNVLELADQTASIVVLSPSDMTQPGTPPKGAADLAFLDPFKQKIVARIPLGFTPSPDIFCSAARHSVVLIDQARERIVEIDGATHLVTKTIPIPVDDKASWESGMVRLVYYAETK